MLTYFIYLFSKAQVLLSDLDAHFSFFSFVLSVSHTHTHTHTTLTHTLSLSFTLTNEVAEYYQKISDGLYNGAKEDLQLTNCLMQSRLNCLCCQFIGINSIFMFVNIKKRKKVFKRECGRSNFSFVVWLQNLCTCVTRDIDSWLYPLPW